MKKITAITSIALALLAATPAFARVRHHQQHDTSAYGQVDSGYKPSSVKNGDVPFAPF
jgi:hypothetical protein